MHLNRTSERPWLAAILVSAASCAPPAHDVAAQAEPLIYGEDDRQDWYAVSPALQALAAQSTAALVSSADLELDTTGVARLIVRNLGEAQQLCSFERFWSQPTLAQCSGVLIDEDLLVTAAHCLSEVWPCERQLWAFGYALTHPHETELTLHEADFYACRSVPLLRHETTEDGRIYDLAVVQLDRPVSTGRRAAPIARDPPLLGAALTVIGHPSGLPVKIDDGAIVLDARERVLDYLELNSDTFTASSGSGVFDATGRLVAVSVRGRVDYAFQPALGCSVARRVGDARLDRAEQASYVVEYVESLCELGWASQRLCGRPSSCGDAQCSLDEHGGVCTDDCPVVDVFLPALTPQNPGCAVAMRPRSNKVPTAVVLALLAFAIRWTRARRGAIRVPSRALGSRRAARTGLWSRSEVANAHRRQRARASQRSAADLALARDTGAATHAQQSFWEAIASAAIPRPAGGGRGGAAAAPS